MLLAQRPHGGAHRGAGGKAVIHQDDGAIRDADRRPIAAEQPLAPLELTTLLLRHPLDVVAGDSVCDHFRIEHANSTARDGAHGQLFVSWKAELAHDEHVHGRAEPPRDLPGDGYSAPRESEHQDVLPACKGRQALAQHASRLSPIAVAHEPTYASSDEEARLRSECTTATAHTW